MSDESSSQVDHDDLALRAMVGVPSRALAEDALRAYGDLAHAYLRKHFSALNAEDIDDILSISIRTVLEKGHTFDDAKGSFRAWVFTILWNHALDILRGRKTFMELTPDAFELQAPQSKRLDDKALQLLREGIRTLTPSERLVIESDLAVGGRASASVIAQRKGLTANSVCVHRSHGREKLRKFFLARGLLLDDLFY
jgi:RNA polymerase sigma factor (sigma-70 family)